MRPAMENALSELRTDAPGDCSVALRERSEGASRFAGAFSVMAPPNRSVRHSASIGAERGSVRVWTGPPGLSASSTQ